MISLFLSAAVALPPTFPLDRVEPGQRGQCLTVFEGDAVEPFPFVVKAVMKDFLGPGRDLVLVRLEGDKAEFTGVVAGMSGSPCSIEGKLLGALAYKFAAFAKEPIAGITPIGYMSEIMELPRETRPWRLAGEPDADWQAFREGRAPPSAPPEGGPRPIATPLSLGGIHPAVRDHFTPYLRGLGFEPVAGGARAKDASPRPLVPGSAVSAVLVSGDVDMAATGTVTVVDGKEVLAFGHPFLGAGATSMPMANATILNTMASQLLSYKQSATGALIGEVTQDRLSAIGGFLGPVPAMVPVHGTVTTPHGKESFDIQVARDLALTPRLLAMGTAGALGGRIDAGARGILRLHGRIEVEGIEPVEVSQVYAAERDQLFVNAAIDMARAFYVLWDTPFGPPPKISVSLDVVHELEPVHEWIEAIYLDRKRAAPGDDMEVVVRMRRNHGGTSLERFSLRVPRSWQGQRVQLVATGVSGAEKLAGTVEGDPRPTELADIGRWLSRRRADGRVYLMAVRDGAGLSAGVDTMPFVPGSAVATFSGDPSKQARPKGLAWEEYKPRPGVVFGEASTTLKVSRE